MWKWVSRNSSIFIKDRWSEPSCKRQLGLHQSCKTRCVSVNAFFLSFGSISFPAFPSFTPLRSTFSLYPLSFAFFLPFPFWASWLIVSLLSRVIASLFFFSLSFWFFWFFFSSGHLEIIKLLLPIKGIKPSAQDNAAIRYGYKKSLKKEELSFRAFPFPLSVGEKSFFVSIQCRNILSFFVPPRSKKETKTTETKPFLSLLFFFSLCIRLAASWGQTEVVKLLITLPGVDVATDFNAPLRFAAKAGYNLSFFILCLFSLSLFFLFPLLFFSLFSLSHFFLFWSLFVFFRKEKRKAKKRKKVSGIKKQKNLNLHSYLFFQRNWNYQIVIKMSSSWSTCKKSRSIENCRYEEWRKKQTRNEIEPFNKKHEAEHKEPSLLVSKNRKSNHKKKKKDIN